MKKKKMFDWKILSTLVVVCVLAITYGYATTENTAFYINGKEVKDFESPIVARDSMYFPLEPIVDTLNGDYDYAELYEQAEFDVSNDEYVAPLDAWFVLVNGEKVAISTMLINDIHFPGSDRLIRRDGDMMAPQAFIEDVLGVKIEEMKDGSTTIYYIGEKPVLEESGDNEEGQDQEGKEEKEEQEKEQGNKGNQEGSSGSGSSGKDSGSSGDKGTGGNGSDGGNKDSGNKDKPKEEKPKEEKPKEEKPKEEKPKEKPSNTGFDLANILSQLENKGFTRSGNGDGAIYAFSKYLLQIDIYFRSENQIELEVRDWLFDDNEDYAYEIPGMTKAATQVLFPKDHAKVYNEIKSYMETDKTNSFSIQADGKTASFSRLGNGALKVIIK